MTSQALTKKQQINDKIMSRRGIKRLFVRMTEDTGADFYVSAMRFFRHLQQFISALTIN